MMTENKIFDIFSTLRTKGGLFLFLPVLVVLVLMMPLRGDTGKEPEKHMALHLEKYKAAVPFYQNGLQLLQQGQPEAADRELRKAVEVMPGHVYAHYHLARSLFEQGRYDDAETHIQQAIRHFQFMTELNAYALSVNSRLLSKDESRLGTLLDRDRNRFDCSTTRDLKYQKYRVENEIKSVEEKKKRLQEENDERCSVFYFLQGNILVKLKKFPEAFRAFQKTTQLSPTHWEAHNSMAALLHLGKAHHKALVCLEEAEALGAGFNINLKLKEDIHHALGKDTEGITQRQYPGGIKRFTVDVNREGSAGGRFYENIYVVYDIGTKDAVIIDPGFVDPRIEAFVAAESLTPRLILNTHGHGDQTAGNGHYASKYKITVAAPRQDAHFYTQASAGDVGNEAAVRYFEPGAELKAGALQIKTLHLPGHTPGGTAFLINGALFSGDAVFKNTIGKMSGQDNNRRRENFNQFITRLGSLLAKLSENTPIYPGHGPATDLKTERLNNPYLKVN